MLPEFCFNVPATYKLKVLLCKISHCVMFGLFLYCIVFLSNTKRGQYIGPGSLNSLPRLIISSSVIANQSYPTNLHGGTTLNTCAYLTLNAYLDSTIRFYKFYFSAYNIRRKHNSFHIFLFK